MGNNSEAYLRKKMELILEAVKAQAEDETLWAVNMPGEEFRISVAEAYMQQSLRWLHDVIEKGDENALRRIIDQAKGNI